MKQMQSQRHQAHFRYALAQISVEDYASNVHIDNEVPELQVSVNSILFTRVLVNLIHNAALAVEKERELAIWIHVRAAGWMPAVYHFFCFR